MDTAGSHQQLWEHLSNPVRGWVAWQRCGIYVCNHWLAPLGGTFFPLPTQWRHPIFNCSVPACPFLQGQLHLLESSFWQKKKKRKLHRNLPFSSCSVLFVTCLQCSPSYVQTPHLCQAALASDGFQFLPAYSLNGCLCFRVSSREYISSSRASI